jgi:hypothetical protein
MGPLSIAFYAGATVLVGWTTRLRRATSPRPALT